MQPKPTAAQRRAYRAQNPTSVGTFTDDLDAWMYRRDGLIDRDVPKPCRTEHPSLEPFLADLERRHRPGWLRVGADLVSFDGTSQERLARAIESVIAQTRRDGQYHTTMFAGHDIAGHWILVAASCIRDDASTLTRLTDYIRAKGYQTHADRSYGVLFDSEGALIAERFVDPVWSFDARLAALVAAMGLVDPRQSPGRTRIRP
jgi:hypothetical protein